MLALILAFENIIFLYPFYYFFSYATMPFTIPLLLMLGMGTIMGWCFAKGFTGRSAESQSSMEEYYEDL